MKAVRTVGIVVIAVALLLVLFNLFQPPPRQPVQFTPYSDLLADVAAGHVREAVITGRLLKGVTYDHRDFVVYLPDEPGLARELVSKGVRVIIVPEDVGASLLFKLLGWGFYWAAVLGWLVYLRKIAGSLRAIEAALHRRPEGDRPQGMSQSSATS